MRFAILTCALVLAIVLGPMLVPQRGVPQTLAVEPIKITRLGAFEEANDVDGASLRLAPSGAGEASLVFIAMPSEVTMPVLPDIPEQVTPFVAADALPKNSPDSPAPAASRDRPLEVSNVVPLVQVGQRDRNRGRITATELNLRSGPAKRFDAVAALSAGDQVEVTGASDRGWLPIRVTASGLEGWVFYRYVDLSATR